MKKVAVIGTGIAGMSMAYFLQKSGLYDVQVFEKDFRIGGHTNTVIQNQLPIDTGFIVFNEQTYPNLLRLFKELKVPYEDSDMSFAVDHLKHDLQYCGSGLDGLFGQRKNLFRPSFYRFIWGINTFNHLAAKICDDHSQENLTVGEFFRKHGISNDVLEYYLVPMSSAVWSTNPQQMLEFPILSLARFFKNHGFLGLNTQFQWKTVTKGSESYKQKLIKSFHEKIILNSQIEAIYSNGNGVELTNRGQIQKFDQVILACHADESLRLLKHSTELESTLLKKFRYQDNDTILHTDSSVMPRQKKLWSSWNYQVDGNKARVTYWMNRLQNLKTDVNYFVSLNLRDKIDPTKILQEFQYSHPVFDTSALLAQGQLPKLNRQNHGIFFCGSYFGYGFHEDALRSSVQLAEELLGEKVL